MKLYSHLNYFVGSKECHYLCSLYWGKHNHFESV